ncbi:MAG: mandelate racemase/muconate lactonizing enzyme family protein [Candidatus Latescibacterota bacterium]|nr:mandelate racemase/muconate lactonizing enzyme family protein [Candidatus Latescibacterota bacterium]
MKITEVRTHSLSYPLQSKFANSHLWNTTRTAGIVEILTDAGIIGWGEGIHVPGAGICQRLIGRDPFDVEVLWEELCGQLGDVAGYSGVDIALWDILGKALGRPVYQLLGGACRKAIPAYASGLFCTDVEDVTSALSDEARGYVDAGFPAVKMKIGFGLDYDSRNTAAVRQAIGDDVLFTVDANCAYDTATAIEVGRRLTDQDIYWYEEPVPRDDLDGYFEIRQALGVRIAGGESLEGRRAFRDLLQRRCVDIVQPDISIAGGFSECRKIQAMASANRIRVLPHMWGTCIRLAATIHWHATIPDDPQPLHPEPSLFEFDMTENSLRTELATERIDIVDGCVPVPEAPGLGIEIDRRVLERYRVG